MISNEDYEQWKPLIKKIAWKYRNNIFRIELDDLEQIGTLGLIKGFKNYKDEGASLKTYLYNCIEWTILREFQNLKRVKRQVDYETTSLNQIIGEDNDITLEDLVEDESVNIEDSTVDKLLEESYKTEVNLCLLGREREIVYKTLFEDKTCTELSKLYNASQTAIRTAQRNGFRHLRHKSKMIRDKWLELKERDLENEILFTYRNPERFYLNKEISENLKCKYRKEISTINFLQEIFDALLYSFKINDKIKRFYLEGLKKLLDYKDLYLLEHIKFKNIDYKVLEDKGYSFEDRFYYEDRIRKAIIQNKEQAYNLWVEFCKNYDESKPNQITRFKFI